MTLHCLIAGHDLDVNWMHADNSPDRCVHCKINFPISRLRLAWEVVLKGALVIALVACAAVARQIAHIPHPAPVLKVEADGG